MIKRTIYFVIHHFAVWVARKTVDPSLEAKLPGIFDRLDYEMPFILRTSNAGSITGLIGDLITKETGVKDIEVLTKMVSQVCELYDPRAGARS